MFTTLGACSPDEPRALTAWRGRANNLRMFALLKYGIMKRNAKSEPSRC
jgi:hypothetical protein